MARKKDLNRTKVRDRLNEVMQLRGYSQVDLINKADEYGDLTLTTSNLSEIMHGKRALPHKYKILFSKILTIDQGYLLGYDDFEAANYKEYTEMVSDALDIEESKRRYSKYDYLLNPLGYSVKSFSDFEDGTGEYGVVYKHSIAQIPRTEMEVFEKDVRHFIKLKIDSLMQRYGHIRIGNSSALVYYRFMDESIKARTGRANDREYAILINLNLEEEEQIQALEKEIEKIRDGTIEIDPKIRFINEDSPVKKV